MEAKVQRALSLNVKEEELFCALYRQYHLDESGEPIMKSTDTHVLSVEGDNHDKITSRGTTQTEEQRSVDNLTEEEDDKEEDAITENDTVTIEDEMAYENDETPITDKVKTLGRQERLQEFFQEFDEESREMLQQQWMTSEMSDDGLMDYLYKLKERGEIMPSVEPKEALQHFPPPLFAFEEELEQITAFEMVSEVQIPTEVQKPTTTRVMLSASHSDVHGDSPLTLFSRQTRWFA
ncbi:hypothetical protein LSM04_008832 [Trypanosoma melophagium]|uniref:uncharacterized protein n=1 Tax=Trypanosoma melophagium TaxID=715481 RepID=UPI00351A906E|nr:hypothetical protein LSM04_008832 [Trypanosoma melophagium]